MRGLISTLAALFLVADAQLFQPNPNLHLAGPNDPKGFTGFSPNSWQHNPPPPGLRGASQQSISYLPDLSVRGPPSLTGPPNPSIGGGGTFSVRGRQSPSMGSPSVGVPRAYSPNPSMGGRPFSVRGRQDPPMVSTRAGVPWANSRNPSMGGRPFSVRGPPNPSMGLPSAGVPWANSPNPAMGAPPFSVRGPQNPSMGSPSVGVSGANPFSQEAEGPTHPPGAQFQPPAIPINNVDYCAMPCGTIHIGCPQNGLLPDGDCPLQPEYISMDEVKDFIVDYHNHLRSEVAAGRVGSLGPAARMGTMQWDHDLHVTATFKALLCKKEGDPCHSTPQFHQPGQNIGRFRYGGYQARYTLQKLMEDQLNLWTNASEVCTRELISNFPDYRGMEYEQPGPKNVHEVGIFTVMIRESNTRVGCGINWFEPVHSISRVFVVCHYATNNYVGVATYKEGQTASECKTGTNPQYPNLCSVNEMYHVHEASMII